MQFHLKTLSAVAIAGVFAVSAAQAREFRSADVHPMDYPTVMTEIQLGKVLSEKTGGNYTVRVYGNSSLGSEKDTVEQAKLGALDMVRVNTAAFQSIIPETMILSLPFLYRDVDHLRKVIYGPIGERVLAKFEKAGFIGLALWESGARNIYAKKPVRTLADVKGMKIRVQQSDLWVDLIRAMGANPTPIPMGEVFTALKTGLVDAAENNYPSYETAHHYEAASVYSETEHVMAPECLVFSKKVWDTLSEAERQNIRAAAKETVPYYVNLWTAKENASKAILAKAGVTFITDVHKAEFIEVEKPLWDKVANTPELKQLVQDIVDTK
ncbi:TRAP transporter substrate-binding protein [Telmatospirillum siberiense]|uniref:C4-dicarboxylate ABC transporter n=1 Tax=Telmatospirillum siberiense TaxID=382514 RepID=A0A2N3Q1D1_9PROT|nr:TRAP transporter substrate-binding protein [Telmatospirillum siberiense]PKU26466.1 C4-dicarboxylate ABC transporter [Telmatospirillum siberiense]